jgi:small conductance mechanosensitive channel
MIIIFAGILLRLSRRLNGWLKNYVVTMSGDPLRGKRIDTLSSVIRYAFTVLIGTVAIMLILGELGVSVAPLFATVGVAGIGIAFGAQTLVKDYFTGLFLLLEDQIREGDIIEAAGKLGHVERVTLRHVRLRDYDGSVHFIPNSIITTVTNKSREFGYAVIEFNVPRKRDLDEVFSTMHKIIEDMRNEPQYKNKILDDIDISGIEKLEDTNTLIRARIKVAPLKQWRIHNEFLKRLKLELDHVDIAEEAA